MRERLIIQGVVRCPVEAVVVIAVAFDAGALDTARGDAGAWDVPVYVFRRIHRNPEAVIVTVRRPDFKAQQELGDGA